MFFQLPCRLRWHPRREQCSRRNKERRRSMCTGCLMMEVRTPSLIFCLWRKIFSLLFVVFAALECIEYIISSSWHFKLNCCSLTNLTCCSDERRSKQTTSSGLTLLLPYLLTRRKRWARCQVRVFVGGDADKKEEQKEEWVLRIRTIHHHGRTPLGYFAPLSQGCLRKNKPSGDFRSKFQWFVSSLIDALLGFWLWWRSSAWVSITWKWFLISTRTLVLRSTADFAQHCTVYKTNHNRGWFTGILICVTKLTVFKLLKSVFTNYLAKCETLKHPRKKLTTDFCFGFQRRSFRGRCGSL